MWSGLVCVGVPGEVGLGFGWVQCTPVCNISATQNRVFRIDTRRPLLCVDLCERGPCGRGWARLFQESRVRLQRQLQVQDVVNDMLEDLHFTDFLILGYSGHEALESAVAVVHVVLQTEVILLIHFALAALRQITHGERTAAGGNLMRANRCAGLHRYK